MKRSAKDYALALHQAVSESPKEARSIVQRFMDLLVADHGRDRLPIIIEELDRLEAAAQGRVIVTVGTATMLTDEEVTDLEQQLNRSLKGKSVEIRQEVEPQLIGGIRIKIGDRVIDHTVKAKLDQLAHQLTT